MRETKKPRSGFAKYEELTSNKPRFMERIRIDWDKSEELKDSYVGRIPCMEGVFSKKDELNIPYLIEGEDGNEYNVKMNDIPSSLMM